MGKVKIAVTGIAIVLLITACASAFQRPEPTADYGNPPQGYEEAIKAHFDQVLKDPESAQYRFERPIKAYGNEGLAYGGKVTWTGYLIDVQVNAKNSFGGYEGFKPYMFMFSGNRVVDFIEGTEHVLIHRME